MYARHVVRKICGCCVKIKFKSTLGKERKNCNYVSFMKYNFIINSVIKYVEKYNKTVVKRSDCYLFFDLFLEYRRDCSTSP